MNELHRAPISSSAKQVTFYEDRAQVTRHARASLLAGTQWVTISGITALVDDMSVQAKALTGEIAVLSVRVKRQMVAQSSADHQEIARLEAEEIDARTSVELARHADQRATTAKNRLDGLFKDWLKSLGQIPQNARSTSIAGWQAAYDSLSEKLSVAAQECLATSHQQEDAQEILTRVQLRLQQARALKPRCEAFIELQVSAQTAMEVELEVTYRTPCALWRPEHQLRHISPTGADGTNKLEITTWATIWQQTGEIWDQVETNFSTARPARVATAPLLQEDVLFLRRKTEEEQRVVNVEVRDQSMAKADLAAGTRQASQMPGVDDGGLPLCFKAPARVSLPSNGQPFRVQIASITLDSTVTRVLLPECAKVAHYRASATLKSSTPLLAGPVRLVRDLALVGRSRLDFVAPGEPFAIGLGPDDALRVRRASETKRDQTPLIGTQKIDYRVKIFISNLSDTKRDLEITERIPVSEIAEVEITLKEAKEFTFDSQSGFLKATLVVEPRETRTMLVNYEIRAKSNVQLPF